MARPEQKDAAKNPEQRRVKRRARKRRPNPEPLTKAQKRARNHIAKEGRPASSDKIDPLNLIITA